MKKSKNKANRLNQARLDVWGEHLANVENAKLSERILELNSKDILTDDESKELKVLIEMEKNLLSESEQEVEKNRKVLSAYYNILDNKLKDDERLQTLFNIRMNEHFDNNSIKTPEDVNQIFLSMMEEDMDVNGHDSLNKEFAEIKKEIEEDENKEQEGLNIHGCGDKDCPYCAEITEEEVDIAIDRLDNEGFFNPKLKEEDKLIELMIIVMRLEAILDEIIDEQNGEEDSNKDDNKN